MVQHVLKRVLNLGASGKPDSVQLNYAILNARSVEHLGGRAMNSELRTGVISVIVGALTAAGTLGTAYFGGFFDLAKTDAANKGTIDLARLKFSNDLIKGALSRSNPADSLLFYADIGLLKGLDVEKVKYYANKDKQEIKQGKPSILPSFDPHKRPNLWLNQEEMDKIAPNGSSEYKSAFVSIGNYLLTGFAINSSARRLSMFLSEVMLETRGLTSVVENGNYSAEMLIKRWPTRFDAKSSKEYEHKPNAILDRIYANRMGNGPETSGDG